MRLFDIIKRPLMSEKNTASRKYDVYVFEVDKKAKKPEIKSVVEKVFQVKVDSIRTSICRDRVRRSNRAGVSKIRYWKKAMVKVKIGQKIALFDGV